MFAMIAWMKSRGYSAPSRMAGGILAATVLALATQYEEGGWFDGPVLGMLLLGLGLTAAILFCARTEVPDSNEGPAAVPFLHWPMAWFLLAVLLLYAASSALTDNWFFPVNWKAPGGLGPLSPKSGCIRSLFLTAGLALGFKPLMRTPRALALAWIGLAGLAVYHLHAATGFAMIYRVDSPAFVYRFWSFLHTFPRPAFYDPHWNAGLPVSALVSTGIWSVGVWLLPFLSWIPAETLYTPFLAVFFLGLLPLLAWWSLAWTGASRRACWIAALMALAPGQRYWVHLLHYGTAPALFAMSMAMPLAALGYKFLYLDPRPRPATLLLLLLCGFTFLAWPGSLLIALPFLLVLLFHARRLFPVKWMWMLGAVALLLLVLLPLALAPLRHAPIARFLETTSQQTLLEHLRNGWGLLGHNLRGSHPLILVFGMLGSIFWPTQSARRFFAPLILLLAILSGWGEEFKKLLQTERLIIPAALVAIIPAATWLDHLVAGAWSLRPNRCAAAALLRTGTAWAVALLLVSGYEGAKAWNGRGLATFHAMPDSTKELVRWLSANVPADGRVMFAGRAVHAYGGAKIAAMPLFTGREMMAADYYGFSPKLVEYQYPPREFRYSGPDVLFSFMELYNVTHIVTWHEDWKNVFHRTTNYYRPVHAIGRTEIFQTRRDSSLFLEGTGEVHASFDRLDVALAAPQDRLIVKYNWAPGWQAQGAVKVFPHDAGRGITLIGVEPGTNRAISLRYRSVFHPGSALKIEDHSD